MYHNLRLFLLLLMSLVLSGCLQSMPKLGANKKPVSPPKEPVPTVVEKSEPVQVNPVKTSAPTKPVANHSAKPVPAPSCNHFAVMLPLKSTIFASSADMVWQGMQAAAKLATASDKVKPLKLYAMQDESAVGEVYKQAEQAGACVLAGPLTRDGVQQLLAQRKISKPTLVLNSIESVVDGPVYGFGLSVESEARQIAQLMQQHQLTRAVVIVANGSLYQRLQQAFVSEWQGLGGELLDSIEFVDDRSVLDGLSLGLDTGVFLATDANKARWIKPYLPKSAPVYATSMLFMGDQQPLLNYDLDGVIFVDMPWLLMADDPIVATYPRSSTAASTSRERLYALGIDAWHLLDLLYNDRLKTSLPLVGVSGDVNLVGQNFERQVMPATFKAGKAMLLDSSTGVSDE